MCVCVGVCVCVVRSRGVSGLLGPPPPTTPLINSHTSLICACGDIGFYGCWAGAKPSPGYETRGPPAWAFELCELHSTRLNFPPQEYDDAVPVRLTTHAHAHFRMGVFTATSLHGGTSPSTLSPEILVDISKKYSRKDVTITL